MPDFARIKASCHGMMSVDAYRRIHETALAASGDFVEIGTGHGAATACMAMACSGTVHTWDRMEGGSRARYGDRATNVAITRGAWRALGVENVVLHVEPAEAAYTPLDGIGCIRVGMLMLDCDGRIDRDLAAFFDAMPAGAPIVVDDVADKVRIKRNGQGWRVDQKHRLTLLLARSLAAHGLIEWQWTCGNVWGGVKMHDAYFADWHPSAILGCYRELVFADAGP